MNRALRVAVALLGVTALAAGAIFAPWPAGLVRALAPAAELTVPPRDTVFTDRTGRPLRHVALGHGPRGDWQPLARHPQMLVRAVLAAEDMRFRTHPGIDLEA